MRHRAAAGVSESSNCIVIIVSEETGKVSYATGGKLKTNVSKEEIVKFLSKDYKTSEV